MLQANLDSEGLTWYRWIFPPCFAVVAFIEGLAGLQVYPSLFFFLLGSFLLSVLPLGPNNFAYPVSRARWFWSRVVLVAVTLAGALGIWALGLLTRFLVDEGALPDQSGFLWSFVLFSAAASGPFLATLPLKARGKYPGIHAPAFLFVAMVQWLIPWGEFGKWIYYWPEPAAWALGAGLVVLVLACWAGTLRSFQKRDAGRFS